MALLVRVHPRNQSRRGLAKLGKKRFLELGLLIEGTFGPPIKNVEMLKRWSNATMTVIANVRNRVTISQGDMKLVALYVDWGRDSNSSRHFLTGAERR